LFYKYRYRLSLKYIEKFLWLQHRNNKILNKKIKPIRYSCVFKNGDINEKNNIKYILHENKKKLDFPKINVNIEADKYDDNKINPLNHTNNKWFINLTNV